jgi:hypothetical protein
MPTGVVEPPANPWLTRAFVADRPIERGKRISILILDDHYSSSDHAYRSDSGVIGDRITDHVLCSVPAQARRAGVALDPAVQFLITRTCRPNAAR